MTGPSDQLNVFERFLRMPMAEPIDHGVFVYHGDFDVQAAAALAAVHQSNILLRKKMPAEALIEAKKAVALQPENLLAQTALGNALTAVGDKDSARAAYELAPWWRHRRVPMPSRSLCRTWSRSCNRSLIRLDKRLGDLSTVDPL